MTTVPNDEVVVPLQNKNTIVPLQGTNTTHPKVDPADEIELENINHNCLGDQLRRGDQQLQMTI